ncbi:dermonecrotic toxin domain-containing protein [Pseudomonas marginalis]
MIITPQAIVVQPHPVSQEAGQNNGASEHPRAKRSLTQTVTQWPVNPQPSPTDARFQRIQKQSKHLVEKSDSEMASQYCAALMLLESRKKSVIKNGDQLPTITDIPPFSTFGQAWALFTQALTQEPFARYARENNIDISTIRWFPHADDMECSINGKIQLFSSNTPGWKEASAGVAAAAKEVAAGRLESFLYTGARNAPIDVVSNFYGEAFSNFPNDLPSAIRDLQYNNKFKTLMPLNGPLTPQATRVRTAQAEVENAIAMATYNHTRGVADANRTPTPSERVEEADRELARMLSRLVTVKAMDPRADATKGVLIGTPEDSSYVQAAQAYKEALSSDAFKRFMQAHNLDIESVVIHSDGRLSAWGPDSDGRIKWLTLPAEHKQWAALQPAILKVAREIGGSGPMALPNYNYGDYLYPITGIMEFYGVREHYGSPQWAEQNAGLIREGFPALVKNNPPNDGPSLVVRERQQAAKQRVARSSGLRPPSVPAPTSPFRRNLVDSAIPAPPPVGPVNIISQRLFEGEPNRQAVVAGLLKDAISKASPALNVDVQQLAFAVPDPANPGRFLETPLMELAINHVDGADVPVFSNDGKFVDTRADAQALTGEPAGTALDIDKAAVQQAISQLPGKLEDALQTAKLDYWGRPPFNDPIPGFGTDTSVSNTPIFAGDRRLMLSDLVRNNLRLASFKHPGLDDLQRETLDMLVRYPQGSTRPKLADDSEVVVHVLASTENNHSSSTKLQTPNLVIERKVAERTIVLVCEPSGKVTPYASLAAVKDKWDENLKQARPQETFSTRLTKVDVDAFYIQANIIITGHEAQAAATEPTLLNTPQPNRSQHPLPDWIKNTSDVNHFILHDLALELASYMYRHKEHTYNSGIPDIRTFIQNQLNALSPPPVPYDINDVEVVFHTPYGGTGAGFGFGAVQTSRMSLSDAFIQNLAGLPGGRIEVRHKPTGALIPALGREGALKALIQKIDVGKNYPELLKGELLDDPVKKTERQLRFAQQVPIELKMKALELTAKGAEGFDNAMGYRYLQAILDPTPGHKYVNGNEITMRPLAFVREPGAAPDVVENMYLIEPKDSTVGPHILYRPLMADEPLLQFPSRQALMETLRKTPSLQEQVIAWLPDEATRVIYDHGGFSKPHLPRLRVFLDEFSIPRAPVAPTLAVDGDAIDSLAAKLQTGQLMNHLYDANAKALTTLAEQQSVSNSQSRWTTFKEGSFLLLNAILPALRGPAAVIGLALQTQGILGDLKTLANEKDGNKEAAMADLLANLASLVLHTSVRRQSKPASITPPRQVPGKPPITVVEDNHLPTTQVIASTETGGTLYRPIIEAFEKDGLLIRTLQLRNAHLEFHNTGENLDSIRAQGDANRGHGGLRKWSLAQADLLPNYYKMGDNAGALPRNMAILALPEKLQDNITAIHEKDAFSGNIQADTRYLGREKAREGMQGLLNDLKNQQGEHPGSALENSEIQTVGVPPDALVGLVFYGSNGQTWEAAKPQFQKAINRAGPEFDGKSYPVFTYKVEGGKTQLEYLETLEVDTKAG